MNAVPKAGATRPPTVLVLDDDAQLRSAAVRILNQRGYRALAADTAAKALEVATSWPGPLDLLICDLVLPGLSGREAANAILARHPELKILFMSGYSSYGSFRLQVEESGWAFLGKPFEIPEFLGAVEAALDGWHGPFHTGTGGARS